MRRSMQQNPSLRDVIGILQDLGDSGGIEEVLKRIPDETQRSILRDRYKNKKTWREIDEATYYCGRQIFRLHKTALLQAGEILADPYFEDLIQEAKAHSYELCARISDAAARAIFLQIYVLKKSWAEAIRECRESGFNLLDHQFHRKLYQAKTEAGVIAGNERKEGDEA